VYKKNVIAHLYLSAKMSLPFFKLVLGREKLKLHTTISNGFYVTRFKQFHKETIDNKV